MNQDTDKQANAQAFEASCDEKALEAYDGLVNSLRGRFVKPEDVATEIAVSVPLNGYGATVDKLKADPTHFGPLNPGVELGPEEIIRAVKDYHYAAALYERAASNVQEAQLQKDRQIEPGR